MNNYFDNITEDTILVVLRDWNTPYFSNYKNTEATVKYFASKLGKSSDEFIYDLKHYFINDWFKIKE